MVEPITTISYMRAVFRLYAQCAEPVCREYGFHPPELEILSCLLENPGTTASEVVEYCILPKANVSLAVEALLRQGYLTRSQDEFDRRRIHLYPTAAARALQESLLQVKEAFHQALCRGISEEEQAGFLQTHRKIYQNALDSLDFSGAPHKETV